MAFDVKDFFNTEIPRLLAENAADAHASGGRFQVIVPGVGEWFIDASCPKPTCTAGKAKADCVVTIGATDLEWVVTGGSGKDEGPLLLKSARSRGFKLFFAGKLKVKGNGLMTIKLERYFAYAEAARKKAQGAKP